MKVKQVGYRFRIYPTQEQKVFLDKHFGCCRFIYNYLLNFREEAYKDLKIKISGFEAKKQIAVLKKQEEYKWLKEVNSQSLQEAALDLEKGYKRFFKKVSKNKPRFKKKLNKQTFKGTAARRNWYKAKKAITHLHYKIANRRKDFLHKTSFGLVNENQVIYVEDLNVKGMMQNRHLSKSIADASWGEFTRQITYKALWRNVKVVAIGRFEPSSKLCSKCNTINKELQLHQRIWKCKFCSATHDRDINAAKNILKIGQGMPKCKPVEKSTTVFSFKRKQVGSMKQEPVLEH